MLAIESIHVAIGSVQVLRGLSLDVAAGRMAGLIGRNGAGKTTLLRSVMGHLAPSSGRIAFDGRDLASLGRHERAARIYDGADEVQKSSLGRRLMRKYA